MQVHDRPALAFYTQPAAMTSAGRYAPLLQSLPRDIPGLAAVVQGCSSTSTWRRATA